MFSLAGGQMSEIEKSARLVPSGGSKENLSQGYGLVSDGCQQFLVFLGLWTLYSNSAFIYTWYSLSLPLFLFVSYKDIGFRAHYKSKMMSSHLKIINLITSVKTLFSNKSHNELGLPLGNIFWGWLFDIL